MKYIGDGGSVLPICRELLAYLRHRVVLDGATSVWIAIISGMPQESVLDPLLFILHISEMVELAENRLYAYADDSTLLAVVVQQQTDLLLLPPLTGTWQGFRSGAITGVL